MKPRILRAFNNTHMGLNHEGLAQVAIRFKLHPAALEEGEFLVFINSKQNKLKIMGGGGKVLAYLAIPGRINMGAIQYVPQCFGAKGFDYDKALGLALEDSFKAKRETKQPIRMMRGAS